MRQADTGRPDTMPSCEAWKDSLLMVEIEAVRRNGHCLSISACERTGLFPC